MSFITVVFGPYYAWYHSSGIGHIKLLFVAHISDFKLSKNEWKEEYFVTIENFINLKLDNPKSQLFNS